MFGEDAVGDTPRHNAPPRRSIASALFITTGQSGSARTEFPTDPFWRKADPRVRCQRPLSDLALALTKECSYASFKACALSAIRSDGCSMPIDSRIVESRTPMFWRMAAGTPE